MNKLLLAVLVVSPLAAYAQGGAEIVPSPDNSELREEALNKPVAAKPIADEHLSPAPNQVLEKKVEEDKSFNARKSHWYSTFGFEAMEYDLPFQYSGAKESFKEEKRKLYGGRLGFGGELYLGAGFMTSTRVEGYYMGTLFEKAKTADPGLADDDIATVKNTGQIFGADAVQTLSYLFDLRVKNPFMDSYSNMVIEPFVEAGIGRAQAWNKKDYNYDIPGQTEEEYDQSFKDDLTNVKVGGGINITSSQGFFLYLKATQNRYDINKRTTKGYSYPNGGTPTPVNGNAPTKLDPIMVYSLGGGYKF